VKWRVLFLCATNGLHSPMAEAILSKIDSERFASTSAGAMCGRLHPLTVAALKEIGLDLASKTPKSVQELAEEEFDYVITLGERPPFHNRNFGRAEIVHWKFDNPSVNSNDSEKQLREFRVVRDQILQRLRLFVLVHARPATSAATI
jgi:arsenate reductase